MIKKVFTLCLFTAIIVLNCSICRANDNDISLNTVHTVVIDAGHGGKDIGCHGRFSYEKNVALEIALKLGKDIKKRFPNVNVIYTRKTDVFVTLEGRAEIANKAHADLFICIHCNAGPASAYGTETWVMGLYKSKANLKVAMRENSSILLEKDYKKKYAGFNPNSPESYIAMSLKQSAHLKKSLMFANDVETQFRTKDHRNDRGVKQAGFWVLYRTTMPSVLIETGFLTNPKEEKYLNSTKGQDSIASSICDAFGEYKTTMEANAESNHSAASVSTNKDSLSNSNEIKNDDLNTYNYPIFKVQIVTSAKKIKTSPKNFNGLSNVDEYKLGELYRYTYGNYKTFDEADNMKDTLRTKGYKDAFVVSFYKGKRITLKKALGMLK